VPPVACSSLDSCAAEKSPFSLETARLACIALKRKTKLTNKLEEES
jgi:hypothetical protein